MFFTRLWAKPASCFNKLYINLLQSTYDNVIFSKIKLYRKMIVQRNTNLMAAEVPLMEVPQAEVPLTEVPPTLSLFICMRLAQT